MIHVLLCQIGTIENLDTSSVRKYLRRFLSDDRIIDLPKILWRPLIEIIIPLRQKKVLNFYKDIWTPGGSPLYVTSQEQQQALQKKLGSAYAVELFLTFTDSYSVDKAYTSMVKDGVEKIIIIPLFPQFSSATTSSVADTIFSQLLGWSKSSKKKKVYIPNMHFVSSFYDHPTYKAMYLAHLRKEIASLKIQPMTIVVSFHGLPRRYVQEGDVYQKHCEATFNYITEAFSQSGMKFILTYQSRFGREEWLGPRTEDTIQELARTHSKDTLAVVCPGFVTDCLETLSEINSELRHSYVAHGGDSKNFFYIPCLNAEETFIEFLATAVTTSASGFIK